MLGNTKVLALGDKRNGLLRIVMRLPVKSSSNHGNRTC